MRTKLLTTSVAVCAILAASLWISAAESSVIETKLPNGFTVLMKTSHAAPVFTAQIWFKVGSRNEHTGITGISHLLEHMLFNSSKHYKKGEISRMVRERGGIDNAATWTDFTYYWELMSSEHLEFALKTLAERMGNALLLERELANERSVVLSEMEGRENDPDTLLYQEVTAAAFTAHPYQWPVIGWRSDVENVPRSKLVEYYRSHYHSNNATLVLVGDFDPKTAMSLVKRYFGSARVGPGSTPVYTVEPKQCGLRRVCVRREGSAERVLMAYHVPEIRHPDTYALMVLDQILSGGRSSRLYQALVEKQLATTVWSSAGARRDPSLFMIGAIARQGVSWNTLEKALLEQVDSIKSTPPYPDELTSAKNQLEAYFVFQNDSVSDQGEQLGYYNTVAEWRYLETLIPNIKAVTAEQVQKVARKYLTEDNLTVGEFIPTGPGPSRNGARLGPLNKMDWRRELCLKRQTLGQVVTKRKRPRTKPTRVTLDNGLVLIVHENHSNPTVAITGCIKAGSCFDPQGKRGVAELVAEMVGRGTKSRTAIELARAIESVGAEMDFSADVERVNFSAKALSRNFDLVLDLLADEMRDASFPLEQFEKAKSEMASTLEQSNESTEDRARRAFYGSVFPAGHPYHEPDIETAQRELKAITVWDLVNFHQSYYRPDTTILVIVGDVKTDDAVELVKKRFGDWTATGAKPIVDIPKVGLQKKPIDITIRMPDRSEVTVMLGHALEVKRSDPDFYAVRIMNQILGGSGALASILGEELREKRGLVYDVHSTFDAELGAGPWFASLGTSPKNVEKAVAVLKQQIARYAKHGPTLKDFQQAREFIIGVFPIALETNAGLGKALVNAEFYSLGLDYLNNYANYYRKVKLEDVKVAARKYLHPDRATLVIAGSYEQK